MCPLITDYQSNNKITPILAGLMLLLIFDTMVCLAAEIELVPKERWNNLFGGRNHVFAYNIGSDADAGGRFAWRIHSGGRTLLRGEKSINIRHGESNPVEFKLQLPPVKSGVIQPLDIDTALFVKGAKAAVAQFRRKVWIFHENPFALQQGKNKERPFYLFDPLGDTERIFLASKIPFESLKRLAHITKLENSCIVVGEGLSMKQYRGLATVLSEAVLAGNTVVCLALKNGRWLLSDPNTTNGAGYTAMTFRGREVITLLDSRLDAVSWPPDDHMISSRIRLEGQRGRILGQVHKQGPGWPWVELDKTNPQSKILLCGFAIIQKWDASPAPRYLLYNILQYAGEKRRLEDQITHLEK